MLLLKIGQFFVKLLDPQLKDNVLGFLNSSPERNLKEEIFARTNFHELVIYGSLHQLEL